MELQHFSLSSVVLRKIGLASSMSAAVEHFVSRPIDSVSIAAISRFSLSKAHSKFSRAGASFADSTDSLTYNFLGVTKSAIRNGVIASAFILNGNINPNFIFASDLANRLFNLSGVLFSVQKMFFNNHHANRALSATCGANHYLSLACLMFGACEAAYSNGVSVSPKSVGTAVACFTSLMCETMGSYLLDKHFE